MSYTYIARTRRSPSSDSDDEQPDNSLATEAQRLARRLRSYQEYSSQAADALEALIRENEQLKADAKREAKRIRKLEIVQVDAENQALKERIRIQDDKNRALKYRVSELEHAHRLQSSGTQSEEQKLQLERLQRQNARLEENAALLQRTLTSLNYQPRDLALPHEILLVIFRQALVIPQWILRAIMHPSPSSLYPRDMATKAAVSSVCKSWNQVACAFLYENIHLRSIGQLVALARTLETRPSLGQLVRRLDISCFVPRGYRNVFESETKRIFDFCPNLEHFGFVPSLFLSFTQTLPKMVANVTSVDFSALVDSSLVAAVLDQLHPTLRHLTISFGDATAKLPALEFPMLNELCVKVVVAKDDAPIWQWTLPVLERLWIVIGDHIDIRYESRNTSWSSFVLPLLAALGTTVKTLILRYPSQGVWVRQEHLASSCPALQHLAMTAIIPGLEQGDTPHCLAEGHPTVQYLDIWCHNRDAPPTLNLPEIKDLKENFPALRIVRFLPAALMHLDRLPVEFPPTLPAARWEIDVERVPTIAPPDEDGEEGEDEDDAASAADRGVSSYDFIGDAEIPLPAWASVVYSVIGAASVNSYDNLDNWPGFTSLEDNSETVSDDTEDAATTGDSDSDSDSNSEDDEESSAASDDDLEANEFYMEEEWEVSREEALAIFSAMVNN